MAPSDRILMSAPRSKSCPMAVQGSPEAPAPALVFVVPRPLRFPINPRHGRALAFCRFVSRSVWFGFVSRVKFLCSFSPSPHCTMLSHPPWFASLPRSCQQTMQMHFSPSAVCVQALGGTGWGSGSRGTRPVPEGMGKAMGAGQPGNPPGHPFPAAQCSRHQQDSKPTLSCLLSAIARAFDWSHPSTMAFSM